jgi:aspartate carbamoyltransferase catalytic subunit
MHLDLFVVRHPISGTAALLAQHALPHVSIINAGDGCHEHPTQAILDALTIMQAKSSFSKLRIAIVGDVLHSRVARSQIYALANLNVAELRVIAPKALLPADIEKWGVNVHHSLESGLTNVDVITVLRLQHERVSAEIFPTEKAFHSEYGITTDSLKVAKPDVIVMHPGPINRGVEIDSEVADGPHSVILKQVTNGVAVRMAVMSLLGKI